MIRKSCSVGLSLLLVLPLGAQQNDVAPVRPDNSVFLRPYSAVTVPPMRSANSSRLASLVRAGTLYLSAQDALALAIENNVDLELARYQPVLAEWRLQRSQAGGLLPGVPSAASQAGTVAAGQGVSGSQSAAGVQGGNIGGGRGGTANAQIAQIGPVTQTLDPIVQFTSSFSHRETPQSNTVQSQSPVLVSNTRNYNTSIQQGFLTGGSVTVNFRSSYLDENSPSNILNPTVAPVLALSFQHNLLRGLGIAVNARTITVSRMNLATSELNFRAQLTSLAVQVLNTYYGLVSAIEDRSARQLAYDVSGTLRDNVRRQVEVGAQAPPELTRAEAQLANSRLALVNAQTTAEQQEIRLKNLLSRDGLADPILASARIQPTDRITLPAQDDLPAFEEMVKQAHANRPDLLATRANLEAAEVNKLGTKNGVLPNLQAFGAMTNAGLAGTAMPGRTPDPYFVGGFGTATAMVFRRNFPTDRIGAFYSGAIRNRAAQADHAIDELQYRTSELSLNKSLNQVEVSLQNAVTALRQARARYAASLKNRELQAELLKAQDRKFELGAATTAEVIQAQRDLEAAKASEIAALTAYSNARITLDQTLGRTLEANHIEIAEARGGKVTRESQLPPQ